MYYLLPAMLLMNACMKEFSESVSDEKAGLNGGFEISKKGMPVNWLIYTQKTTGLGNFNILLDSSAAIEGKRCLHFSVKECSNKGGRFSPGISTEVKANTGSTYRITCKIKNQGSNFCIQVSGVNAFESSAGPELSSAESIPEWREIELKYTLAKNMEKLRLEINVLSAGDFYIDALEIEKTSRQ